MKESSFQVWKEKRIKVKRNFLWFFALSGIPFVVITAWLLKRHFGSQDLGNVFLAFIVFFWPFVTSIFGLGMWYLKDFRFQRVLKTNQV